MGAKPFRLGFFTRLVDDAPPAELYARAMDMFERAERLGFDAGWVAQHHAHSEGGLPSPLVFLSAVAARTQTIRLVTGIITLPFESPLRLAEDAAVLDAMSRGRLELGFGTGGNAVVARIFGRDLERRHADYESAFEVIRDALAGRPLGPDGPPLYPAAPRLVETLWEATFRPEGAVRIAERGSGLLLARTAQRQPGGHRAHLGEAQQPIVDAYMGNLKPGARPRIGLSRSAYVARSRGEALADAERGMRAHAQRVARREGLEGDLSVEELLVRSDVHFGSPAEVAESIKADRLLGIATDLMVQVHPVDPSHEKTMRSLELMAEEVGPMLGWHPGGGST